MKIKRLFDNIKDFVQYHANHILLFMIVFIIIAYGTGFLSPLFEKFTDADIKTGTKVNFKTKQGKYLSICKGETCGKCCVNNLCLVDENQGDASKFELIAHDEKLKRVSIKTMSGDYLLACENCCGNKCKNIICADSANVKAENGIFTLVADKGHYLLKTQGDKYMQLCAECNQACRLICAKTLEKLDTDNLGLEIIVV